MSSGAVNRLTREDLFAVAVFVAASAFAAVCDHFGWL